MTIVNLDKFPNPWDAVESPVAPGCAGLFDTKSKKLVGEVTPEAGLYLTALHGAALNPQTFLVPAFHYGCPFCKAVTPNEESTANHNETCVYTAAKRLTHLPKPRLQHRWIATSDDPTYNCTAIYELILPLYSDYARDHERHGFLPVELGRTRSFITDGQYTVPIRAGAYSYHDSKLWGNLPIYVVSPDWETTLMPGAA